MGDYRVTIDGVARDVLVSSFEIKEVANGIAIASLEVDSLTDTPRYRPESNRVVVVTDLALTPAAPRFAGLTLGLEERGTVGPQSDAIRTRIDAADYSTYTERRYASETIPAGTVKAALLVLVTYLAPAGTTLDPGQVDGPMLPEMVFEAKRLDECLTYIATLTNGLGTPYLWRIDYNNVLSMHPVGAESCPFDLIEGAGTLIGDVTVTTPAATGINQIHVIYGSSVITEKSDTWIGDGVTDTFPVTYFVSGPIPYASDTAIGHGALFNYSVTPWAESTGGLTALGLDWEYDPVASTMRRRLGPPAVGAVIYFWYDVQFPQHVIVSNVTPPDPIWEQVIVNTSIFDKAEATALAQAELDRQQSVLKTVTYATFAEGARPGQVQTITVPTRALTGSWLITEVVTRQLVPQGVVQSVITAVGGETFQGSFRDLYKDWLGGDTTVPAGRAAAPAPGSAGVPALPPGAVQFNRAGTFGGDAAFTYDETTHSVVGGALSSIDAAAVESCQVFGYDCHLADP